MPGPEMSRIVTKTMAEVYIRQGHLREAYEILKALAEKTPSDPDLRKRLEEVSEKLSPALPLDDHPLSSKEEKIRILERWLANIQERKRR